EREFFHIYNGFVERYHDLAMVVVLEQDRTLISIIRAQPAAMPIVVHELERHALGTQAFVPMNGEAFVVFVALGDDKPVVS
ncbi:ureidoglycolate hydrolase, partial [Salmonella enterica subsp. enterica serovar Typhimurium]|uniref:ureidoglycolate lyase n=1 Tax=Salmonella enterica TaxID=28901 RepID=UPI0007A9072C